MAKQRKNAPGFEESLARLEEIIRLTEAPVTELEDMIAPVSYTHLDVYKRQA